MTMLSRPSIPSSFLKPTLAAAVASLVVVGGLAALRMQQDTCSVSTANLDAQAARDVTQHVLACKDYEHGRITKQQYQQLIVPRASQVVGSTMWATSVLGYSTQYSDTQWSAQQALGAPNVYPQHGDIGQAWASRSADDHDEWIELGYDTPRAVSAVEIYETFNAGSVRTVELITTSGRRIELRPESLVNADRMPFARKLVIPTPCTSEPIAAVRVNVNSITVAGWNEIDAVGLVPCAVDTTVTRQ